MTIRTMKSAKGHTIIHQGKPLPEAEESLEEAIRRLWETTWKHHRSAKRTLSQAEKATAAVAACAVGVPDMENARASDITPHAVRSVVADWYREGLSPATITFRLNCLSQMGVKVEGMRPPKARKLKWWLTPEEADRAYHAIQRERPPLGSLRVPRALAAYIALARKTGLRVEEVLALTPSSLVYDTTSPGHTLPTAILVPGLKTSASQATLPLSPAQGNVVKNYLGGSVYRDYRALEADWAKLRAHLDWPKEATLKGLRRTAARYLHVDCGMPLDMVRQYLRHETIATTMEYLRLTGGYREEEMRRYLK